MTITITSDSAQRANQSGWGTASDGQTWVLKSGTGALSIASNELVCTNASSTGSNIMILGSAKIVNGDLSTRFSMSGASSDIAGMMLRYIDNNNFIRIQITTGHITLRRVVAGVQQTDTVSTASPALSNNTFYRIHTNINNNVYSTNVWLDGTSEPGGFQAAQTDAGNNFVQPTQYGLYAFIGTINDTVQFDSFLVQSTPPVVYVSPTGSDTTGDGSFGNPYATITKADANIGAGSTVNVLSGTITYSATASTITNGTPLARVVWQSYDAYGTAKFSGTMNNSELWIVKGNYTDVVGFDLNGGTLAKIGISNWGHHNRFFHNVSHDIATGLGVGAVGAGFFSYAGITAIGTSEWAYNEARNCGQGGNGSFECHGFYMGTTADNIHDNKANNCAGWGFNISGSSFSAGNQMTIYHNLSFHNTYGGFVCQLTADFNIFANNISYNNNTGLGGILGNGFTEQNGPGTHNVYTNNCSFAQGLLNYANIVETVTNPINANPQFINYVNDGSGDYHLSSTSPCIGAGVVNTISTQDFEGNMRPQGGSYDIGAYEFVAFSLPLAQYAMNGRPLNTQPYLVSGPRSLAGTTLPAGTTFTLFFQNPLAGTFSALATGVKGQLTFLVGGLFLTGTVQVSSVFTSPTFLVSVTTLADISLNTRVISTPFF